MIDIQVEGLIKSFEIGKNVLDGITFQIDQGERVGLLGRNGAGKSTLFRILTGELEPDEGQAIIASGRRVGYAACANAASFVLGYFPVHWLLPLLNWL